MDNATYPDNLIEDAYSASPGSKDIPIEMMQCVYAGPDFFNPNPADQKQRGMSRDEANEYLDSTNAAPRSAEQDLSDGAPHTFCPCCGVRIITPSRFCPECGSPIAHG